MCWAAAQGQPRCRQQCSAQSAHHAAEALARSHTPCSSASRRRRSRSSCSHRRRLAALVRLYRVRESIAPKSGIATDVVLPPCLLYRCLSRHREFCNPFVTMYISPVRASRDTRPSPPLDSAPWKVLQGRTSSLLARDRSSMCPPHDSHDDQCTRFIHSLSNRDGCRCGQTLWLTGRICCGGKRPFLQPRSPAWARRFRRLAGGRRSCYAIRWACC